MSHPESRPSTWIVSRHAGALEWLRSQGIEGEAVAHLRPELVQPGDRVVGTLPLQMVAALCARGASYLHLSLDVPAELRGRELSAAQMAQCGARLEGFEVRPTGAA